MQPSYLHIVCFSVPYPADYGGVIEVFYKIKALHKLGVKIILHCFIYDDQKPQEILEDYCDKVHYYKRDTGLKKIFKLDPYIVVSRENEALLDQLVKDNYPILFEGVHCTAFLNHPLLKGRKKFVRMANIESNYYKGLSKASSHWLKKIYYALESWKLKRYELKLQAADKLLAISKLEHRILGVNYGEQVVFLPPFHPYQIETLKEEEAFLLYHGNLKVEENDLAAIYLVENVFSKLNYKSIVAGKNPSDNLKRLIANYPQISLVDSPGDDEMQGLIGAAKVNVLYTKQSTGLKLKLLNVLYNGHAVVVNKAITDGTLLNDVVIETSDDDEMLFQINKVMLGQIQVNYEKRKLALAELYDNEVNAKALSRLIWA